MGTRKIKGACQLSANKRGVSARPWLCLLAEGSGTRRNGVTASRPGPPGPARLAGPRPRAPASPRLALCASR